MATKKANSKLLQEAIADARAVRETALKNAELAIQEALTPRLQSIISRRIQAEMEEEDDDVDVLENDESSEIGDGGEPNSYTNTAQTELDPETEEETDPIGLEYDDEVEVVDDLTEEDKDEYDVTGATYDVSEEEMDADEIDLEEIIKELESELEEDEDETDLEEDEHELDTNIEVDNNDDEVIELDLDEEEDMESDEEVTEEDEDETVDALDLEEILREMGYGDDEEDEVTEEEEEDRAHELEAELGEAYKTIKFLKRTINEVNLLNAKLLFANKVFRQYNLTNEQKIKIVESFDRTSSVREVKLVFATISESMKLTGTQKVKKLTEGFASKATKSTAPKKIINENVDFGMEEFQKRNQELAGIIRK
jgi:hypothetical protein